MKTFLYTKKVYSKSGKKTFNRSLKMALSYKNVTDQFDKDTSWKTFFGGVLKLCGTFCGFLKF